MRKTLLIIVSSLGTLFFAGNSIESFATQSDGYNALKTAMKNTNKVENASVTVASNVWLDDNLLQSITMDTAYSLTDKLGQGNITVDNQEEALNFKVFYQNNEFLVKKNNMNFLIKGNILSEKMKLNSEMVGLIEKGIDTLTYQVHDEFVIKGNTIIADLPASKIPIIIQQGSQFFIKKITPMVQNSEYLGGDLSVKVPSLVSEVKTEHIKVATTLTKDNLIDYQSIFVKISGKDASGVKHTIVSELYLDYSDINNTYIEPVNIDYNDVITPI